MGLRIPGLQSKTPPDPRWEVVKTHEAMLRDTWGLGYGEKGDGYRKRLRRLCEFLDALEAEAGTAPDDNAGDFHQLYRGLVRAPIGPLAREAYLCRLEDLAAALKALLDGEKGTGYLDRWQAWQQNALCAGQRQAELERVLRKLGALPPAGAPPQGQAAPQCLLELRALLDGLQGKTSAGAGASDAEARSRWGHCVDDLAADYEWAYLQVLVRLARECLQEKVFSPSCCRHAQTAKAALAIAIPRLEKQGSNQPSVQGLYGLLAAACLTLGKLGDLLREERQQQIESALVFARRAVELAPESIRERLVLLEVLSSLGDPEDIKVQAEIALNLDSGPETLRTIGDSYWGRTVAVRGRGARRQLLREAIRFFAQALENVESATLDERRPVDQMQAHGWAHFWLGRFQSELARYAEAAAHLRTASSLGFKPLEAQVELAWTCLFASERKDADKAFRAALVEAARQRAGGAKVAVAPGEERPIDDLAFEGYLGWAFLCAEWDPERALWYARKAEHRLAKTSNPKDPELLAALLEVGGRILLHQGEIHASVKRLEAAVLLSPRSGAYCALGFAYLSPSQTTDPLAPDALRRAREAYRLGRKCAIRGRYRGELWDLNRELRKREGSTPTAAALTLSVATSGSTVPIPPPGPPQASPPKE